MRKTSAVALAAAIVVAPQLGGTAHAAQPAAAKKPSITATTREGAVDLGKRLTFIGKVTGPLAGVTVTTQQLVGKRWVTVGTGKLDKRGNYTIPVTPKAAGVHTFRSLALKGKTQVAASKNARALVARWIPLSDLSTTFSTEVRANYRGKIGETKISNAWGARLDGGGDYARTDWRFGGLCMMAIGIPVIDRAITGGGRVTFKATADGNAIAEWVHFIPGVLFPVLADSLIGVDTLTFEASSTSSDDLMLYVDTAMVKCAL